jgi:hypothetical protein
MSLVQRRLVIVLAAALVGGIFVAGLFIHGRFGGALLLLTDAILIALARITWPHLPSRGRPIRLIIIAAIAAIAAVKLVAG